MSAGTFYDELTPFYHLIFPDWEASIRRQADALDSIIRERWGDGRFYQPVLLGRRPAALGAPT